MLNNEYTVTVYVKARYVIAGIYTHIISIVADSDPGPDPCVFGPPESASVAGTDPDPDPDPSIIKQK